MRPVLLEIDGFTSYRTKAVVDFRGADFFVLVGPTGGGKSTVIDAMIFALYGTAPRWGDRGAVAPALAPTANRGTVRLIFDVGGKRYVAVRDVRRGGGRTQAVSVREARLEEYHSADATGAQGDTTTPLASGSPNVTRSVEALLGLTYEQFIRSVALPQGEFARFLHATDGERQAILKSLLRYSVYDDIQHAANGRANEKQQRVDTLTEQLAGYGDATPEHVEALDTALKDLRDFQTQLISVDLPALKAAIDEATAGRTRYEQLTAEREELLAVTPPRDIDDLTEKNQLAITNLQAAEAAQTSVEVQDHQARAALQEHPPRHQLEQTIGNWTALNKVNLQMPALTDAVNSAKTRFAEAKQRRDTTSAAVETHRGAAATAKREAESKKQLLTQLHNNIQALDAVRRPEQLTELSQSVRNANEKLEGARRALDEAEAAQKSAIDRLVELPDSAVLASVASDAQQLSSLLEADRNASTKSAENIQLATAARAAATTAAAHCTATEVDLHHAERSNAAAAIRTELQVGDDCPVCGGTITEIPSDNSGVDDLSQLRADRDKAKAEADAAAAEATLLENSVSNDRAVRLTQLRAGEDVRVRLISSLAALDTDQDRAALGQPISEDSAETVLTSLTSAAVSIQNDMEAIQQQRTAAETTRRAADTAVTDARSTVQEEETAAKAAADQISSARAALRGSRDSVSPLDPPQIDDSDVEAGWNALCGWAAERSRGLSDDVAALSKAVDEAATQAEAAENELESAEATAREASQKFTEAAVAQQTEVDQLGNAVRTRSQLTELLADAPSIDELRAELEQVIDLQAAVDAASLALTKAREATSNAKTELQIAATAVQESSQELRRLRDPLTRFGAPEITGTNLALDWRTITEWSATEAASRLTEAEATERKAVTATELARTTGLAITEAFADRDIEIPEELIGPALLTEAPSLVASAAATASAAARRAKERLGESETMTAQIKQAGEDAAVAKTLAQLMRSTQFPRWLIASALDTLLADASKILLELSGGQFELTRDERDLLVIDHNDADMSRPVKTLSGGETFQASLALALALSEHVTSLSAAGATKLESIFLDEGFGTLDDATLDIVAGTLESLASSGSRMVGVITHVGALAERIPVRFRVYRDSAGSHVEREQL